MKTRMMRQGIKFDRVGADWLPDISQLIRKRLDNPKRLKEEHNTRAIGETIIRQLCDNQGSGLRLSSCGSCIRQQAFAHYNWVKDGHTIDGAARLTFAVGDALEAMIVACLKEACVDVDINTSYMGDDQLEVSIEVPFGESGKQVANIVGHPDGMMNVPIFNDLLGEQSLDKEWVVLEIKSMSDYAFKRFRADGLSKTDSYYYQIQAYMLATGTSRTYILAFGKASAAKDAVITEHHWEPLFPLVGQWIKEDKEIQREIQENYKTILTSRSPFDLNVPFKPNKKGRIGFPCDYCSYHKHCYPKSSEVAETSKWLQSSTKVKLYVGENDA